MKAAILAGGRGTRLNADPGRPPKPLANVGDEPIIWHLMKFFRDQGVKDFVVATGHQAGQVTDWFRARAKRERSLMVESGDDDRLSVPADTAQNWRIRLVDTGPDTANGSRLARLAPWLKDERFFLSWCDGLCDADLAAMQDFHDAQGADATILAVNPRSRFGVLELDGERVTGFAEKPLLADQWINGGIFVLEPGVLAELGDEGCEFERDVLTGLARRKTLRAWRHRGFWACMDTPAEQRELDRIWRSGEAPWAR